MRPDVKLGVAISGLLVLIAGTYYIVRGKREQPIPVGNQSVEAPDGARPADHAVVPEGDATRRAPTRSASPDRGTGVRRSTTAGTNGATRKPTARPKPARSQADDPRVARGGDINAKKDELDRNVAVSGAPSAVSSGAEGAKPGDDANSMAGTNRNATTQPGVDSSGMGSTRQNDPGAGTPSAPPIRTVPLAATRTAVDSPTTSLSAAAVETHRVQPGDTLSSLAERYFGSSRYVGLLQDANPQITDARRLTVGTTVRIPPQPNDALDGSPSVGSSGTAQAESGARRMYTVRAGDSFYKIARDVLGSASRWQELFELNRNLVHGDPTRLQIGQKIVLPSS